MIQASQNPRQSQTCYHCGEPIVGAAVVSGDREFCCNGCVSVYQFLSSNNLCTYYDLEQHPGATADKRDYPEDAELEVMAGSFEVYRDQSKVKLLFQIPAIHCSSCIWLLEKADRLDAGILQTRVDFVKKELLVTYDPTRTDFVRIVKLLFRMGYAPLLSGTGIVNQEKKEDKKVLLKLAVAGFCFGNIMLFSFPEYLGIEEGNSQNFRELFGWLNIGLSLPVIFYSAGHYFRALFQSFRGGQMSVDVPLAVGIGALWLRSLYEVLSGTGGGYFDSMTGLVFFLVIGKWLQNKTFDAIRFDRNTEKFLPLTARIMEQGKWIYKKLAEISPGQRVQVRHGEVIPCDGVLMSETAAIDYSFVTGEADPVGRSNGDVLFAGGRVDGGMAEIEVLRPFSESRLKQLWSSSAGRDEYQPLSDLSARISKWFTVSVILLAAVSFAGWAFFDLSKAYFALTAVLMVACPCALALAPAFAFSKAARHMAAKGLYLKKPEVVEGLGVIDRVIFDKTGTLTDPAEQTAETSAAVDARSLRVFRSVALHSTHPYSRAIAAGASGDEMLDVQEFEEIPGKGVKAMVSGEPVRIGSASWVGVSSGDQSTDVKQVYAKLNGYDAVPFRISSSFRIGLDNVLKQLKNRYSLSLLSGDHPVEKTYIESHYPGVFSEMIFEADPAAKAAYIRGAEKGGSKVLMVGDGVNDATALKEASVGMVLTQNVNNFTPASSAILLFESFGSLPRFLSFSRKVNRVVVEAFLFSMLYNAVGLYFAISAQLSPLVAAALMPVSSISIVLFSVFRTHYHARKEQMI